MSNVRKIGDGIYEQPAASPRQQLNPQDLADIGFMVDCAGWKKLIQKIKADRESTISMLRVADPCDSKRITQLQSALDMQEKLINITPESLARAIMLSQSPGGKANGR